MQGKYPYKLLQESKNLELLLRSANPWPKGWMDNLNDYKASICDWARVCNLRYYMLKYAVIKRSASYLERGNMQWETSTIILGISCWYPCIMWTMTVKKRNQTLKLYILLCLHQNLSYYFALDCRRLGLSQFCPELNGLWMHLLVVHLNHTKGSQGCCCHDLPSSHQQ